MSVFKLSAGGKVKGPVFEYGDIELNRPEDSIKELGETLRTMTTREYLLLGIVVLAAFVSTWLTVKLSLDAAPIGGKFIAGLFGLLWGASEYVFASIGFFHKDRNLALMSRCATVVLILGSVLASLTFLGDSAENYSREAIVQSVAYQDLEAQRVVLDTSIGNKQKAATIDIETGYRKRGLATEEAVRRLSIEYSALGQEQTALLQNVTPRGAFNTQFAVAAFMLEIMAILALFLLQKEREINES